MKIRNKAAIKLNANFQKIIVNLQMLVTKQNDILCFDQFQIMVNNVLLMSNDVNGCFKFQKQKNLAKQKVS